MAFNHEVVPDYLRTKPDPEVDDKMMQFQTRANQTTPEILQVTSVSNDICVSVACLFYTVFGNISQSSCLINISYIVILSILQHNSVLLVKQDKALKGTLSFDSSFLK